MSASERVKGRRGEREVAVILEAHGFTVRGLESGGDLHAVGHGLTLHVEVKRQERGFRTSWAKQARDEAPPGSIPVVIYRRSRQPWTIALIHSVGWALIPFDEWLAALDPVVVPLCEACGETTATHFGYCATCYYEPGNA